MVERKFNDYEAFKIGVNLEKQGVDFYSRYAQAVESPETREIMLKLAEDEREHQKVFEELCDKAGDEYKGQPLMDDELISSYLNALVDPDIFTKEPGNVEAMDEQEALKFALEAEKKSILFYYEASRYSTSASGRKAFERIVVEEQKHFVIISDRLSRYKKTC